MAHHRARGRRIQAELSGSLRRQGAACPAAAGYVVLYIPEADFMGQDVVSIEVNEGGQRTTMYFAITVEAESATPALL